MNIPLLRLIANGQIFNPSFLRPMDGLKEVNVEVPRCQELLDQWIQEGAQVKPWGNLTIVMDNRLFPARSFSFSPNERLEKIKFIHKHRRGRVYRTHVTTSRVRR